MEKDILSDIYQATRPAIFRTSEPIPKALLETASGLLQWSRAFNFTDPIPGHYDIKGIRFIDYPDGTDMFLVRHNGTGISWDEVKQNDEFGKVLLKAVKETVSKPVLTNEILDDANRKYRGWLEETGGTLTEICPGYYFQHNNDLTGFLTNSLGQILNTPLNGYEYIMDFKYIGNIDGTEHFAVKSTNWKTQDIIDYSIFDLNGKLKYATGIFYGHDDEVTINSVVKEWQDKMKKEKKHKTPARKENYLIDKNKQNRTMKIRR